MDASPPKSFQFDGDLPDALRQFYELRYELPHTCLGGAHDFGELSPKRSGHIWFCELSGNWHLGVMPAEKGDVDSVNDGWDLCRYAADPDEWMPLPGVRLDHLLLESGLTSLFYLPNTLEVDILAKNVDADELCEEAVEAAEIVWIGKFRKRDEICCFDYDSKKTWWDARGILFHEIINLMKVDGREPIEVKRRYASFCRRNAMKEYLDRPGWGSKGLLSKF